MLQFNTAGLFTAFQKMMQPAPYRFFLLSCDVALLLRDKSSAADSFYTPQAFLGFYKQENI